MLSLQGSLKSKKFRKWTPLKCRKLGVLGGTETKFRALGDLLKELSLLKQDQNMDDIEKSCWMILNVRA